MNQVNINTDTKPIKRTRRFMVDAHNGQSYFNHEIIYVGEALMSNQEVIDYIREHWDYNASKIYSIAEIIDNSITFESLQEYTELTPELEAKLIKGITTILYVPQWEPLSAYDIMP